MKFTDITEAVLNKEYKRIMDDFTQYFSKISEVFSLGAQKLSFVAEQDVGKEYPFAMTKELHDLWLFAKGAEDLPNAGELCEVFMKLYWLLPGQNTYQVEWQTWEDTVIGCIVRTALSRIKLNNNEDLSGPEVALLSGLSIESINKYTLSGRLKAERETGGKRWIYKADEIRKFISGRAE